MTCLVYLVLTLLPETAAIFSMNGMFMFQALIDSYYLNWCDTSEEGIKGFINTLLENKIIRIAGSLIFQFVPILTASVFIGVITKGVNLMLPIALSLCLIVLSAVWCTKWQEVGTAVKSAGR